MTSSSRPPHGRQAPRLRPWQVLVLTLLAAADLALLALIGPRLWEVLQPAPVVYAAPAAGPGAPPASASRPLLVPVLPTPLPQPLAVTPPPAAATPFSLPASAISPSPLPDSAQVEGVVGHGQSLPLSCESRSAADWAAFFGVAVDELEFFTGLPASSNPDFGFVGDVRGTWGGIPPTGYGVHADPVAIRLRTYGLNAYAHRGLSWDQLRAQVAAGQPVIAWVTGHVEPGTAVEYAAPDGLTTLVARFEHTVIVTGYTPENVTVVDGRQVYTRPLSVFLLSWGVLGNQAIVRGLLPASH